MSGTSPSAPAPNSAEAIYQAFLDETSTAILADTPEVFCRRVLLPYVMRTARDEIVVETWDDLMADARQAVEAIRVLQPTDFIRIALAARFVAPDTIEGWHRTYVLRGAHALTPPYENRMVLRHTEGTWMVILSEHELSSLGGLPLAYLEGAPGSLAPHWEQARAVADPQRLDADRVYAAWLASLDRANAARDFEAWARHFIFPLAWHLTDSDQTVRSAEEIRGPFFENQNSLVIEGRETSVHRRITKAEFLQDGRILGYHEFEWRDGDTVLFGPVNSRTVLRLHEGQLAAEDISNNLDAALFMDGILARTGPLPTFREIERRTRRGSAPITTHNEDETE